MTDSAQRKRLVSGGAWLMTSAVGQYVVQFLAIAILAHLLTPVEFGLVAAAMVIIGFSAIFSEFGVGPSLVQKEALQDADIGTANTLTFMLGVVLVLLVQALAGQIASFFQMPDLVPVLRVMAWMIPLSALNTVPLSLLQRGLQFSLLAKINIISYATAYVLIGIPLAFAGKGVWALVAAYLAQAGLCAVLAWWLVPKARKLGFAPRSAAKLMHFGTGYSLSRIANVVAAQGDNLVVGRTLGAASLGLYSRAYQLMVMPAMLLGGVVDKLFFPTFARMTSNPRNVAKLYARAVSVTALLGLPLGAVMIVLSREIVLVVFGKQWLGAVPAFQLLAACLYFRMGYKISVPLVNAFGAVYQKAARQFVYAGLVLLAAWLGSHWGITGVAAGVAMAVVVNFCLMLDLCKRILGCHWEGLWRPHFLHLGMALSVGCLGWLVRHQLVASTVSPLITLIVVSLVCLLLFSAGTIALARAEVDEADIVMSIIRDRLRALMNRGSV